MNKVITRNQIIKTLEINGIKKLEDIISNECYSCKSIHEDEDLELIGYFPNAIKGKRDDREEIITFTSNTDFPLNFETAVIITMCNECISDSISSKNILMVPINHNGDYKNDYYLRWDLERKFKLKKLNEMSSLVLETLVIDFVPHPITEMDIMMRVYNPPYIKFEDTPYLKIATINERSLYRQIRELKAWSYYLKQFKKKVWGAAYVVGFLFILYIMIPLIIKYLSTS